MHAGRREDDRRNERRSPKAGRIGWRPAGTSLGYHGWLSDRSPSSLSFVAPSEQTVCLDDEIEVIGVGFPRRRYRVTRTARYDDRLLLVACRCEAAGAGSQAH